MIIFHCIMHEILRNSKNNKKALQNSIVVLSMETQFVRMGRKLLYPMSHPTSRDYSAFKYMSKIKSTRINLAQSKTLQVPPQTYFIRGLAIHVVKSPSRCVDSWEICRANGTGGCHRSQIHHHLLYCKWYILLVRGTFKSYMLLRFYTLTPLEGKLATSAMHNG